MSELLYDFPNAVEMEKQFLSALLQPDDLYRPEYQMIFRAIIHLFAKGSPVDLLSVEEKFHNDLDSKKILP